MKTFMLLPSVAMLAVGLPMRPDPNPSISGPQMYSDGDACDVYSAVLFQWIAGTGRTPRHC